MIIGIILILLVLLLFIINKHPFSDIIQTNILLSYKIPIDNVLLFPLIVIVESQGKSADNFNKEYSNYSIENKENLFKNNKGNIDTLPPPGITNNNYPDILSKGDNPYFSILLNDNTLLKPLEFDKKYVIGISLKMTNGKNTKFIYVDLVFSNINKNNNLEIIYPGDTNLDEIKNIDLIL